MSSAVRSCLRSHVPGRSHREGRRNACEADPEAARSKQKEVLGTRAIVVSPAGVDRRGEFGYECSFLVSNAKGRCRSQAKPTGKDFSRVKPTVLDPGQQPARSTGHAVQLFCRRSRHGCNFDPGTNCRIPLAAKVPGACKVEALPASFLKHADEQTIVGICALSQVLQLPTLTDVDFTQWGVIAAPRFLGRAAMSVSLLRFAAEGAWGISPHLVPHRSLHALSGTVSQALRIHGPNFGVGGGNDSAAEGLLAAGALFADQNLPGIWVVLTAFDPELVPADPTAADADPITTECVAIALALVPVQGQTHGFFLSVTRSCPQRTRREGLAPIQFRRVGGNT